MPCILALLIILTYAAYDMPFIRFNAMFFGICLLYWHMPFVNISEQKKDAYKTKCLDGSLSPKWNDSRLISIPKMTEEILEAFESDSITFTVYGKQVEGKGAAPKVKVDGL